MQLSFKIKEIPSVGAPLSVRRKVPAELLEEVLSGTGGDPARAACELELELNRDHDDVFGRGRLRGRLEVPCARCLEPARVDVDTRLDVVFSRDPADEDAPLDAPDSFAHDGTSFALDEPVRELLIAELPISALCKTACRGLCATCGANRNTTACGHEEAEPSLAGGLGALGELKLS